MKKKYVVLEHLLLPDRGLRFWSMNRDYPERLSDGRKAYKIVFETDSDEEAVNISQATSGNTASQYELIEFYRNEHNENSVQKNLEAGLKTSWAWEKESEYVVLDPDGWDRKNYEYSWNQELITLDEFNKRLMQSTVYKKSKT